MIPIENILIETDSPWLINKEGIKNCEKWKDVKFKMNNDPKKEKLKEMNEPKFLEILLESFSKGKGLLKKDFSEIILSNSKRVFNLK